MKNEIDKIQVKNLIGYGEKKKFKKYVYPTCTGYTLYCIVHRTKLIKNKQFIQFICSK